jgi:hypothetical protein
MVGLPLPNRGDISWSVWPALPGAYDGRVDIITAAMVGALIAIVGGVIFRRVEADHQRRHWFRDQLRLASEQFLSDASKYLGLVRDRLRGELMNADADRALKEPQDALAIDIARLQLVAEQSVFDAANDVANKLSAAFKAAKKVPLGEVLGLEAADGFDASVEAFGEMRRFAEVMKRHLN